MHSVPAMQTISTTPELKLGPTSHGPTSPHAEPTNASRYSKLSVLTCVVLVWFHIQALAAFWSFSWTNLAVALVLYWVSVGLGISMGYHRLHTHRGFKTFKLFDYFLAVCGTLTLEGGPIFWVATHRLHHQYSDEPQDPHTPRVSGFWAHIGWIMFGEASHNDTVRMARYAPDLGKDPFYRWLTTYHWVPLTVLGFTLLAIGGWPLVNWAIFLRVVVGLHSTWLATLRRSIRSCRSSLRVKPSRFPRPCSAR